MTTAATVQSQQQWEYHCVSRTAESYLLSDLNEAGRDGWELVSTQQHKNLKGATVWTAFLKRPRVPSRGEEARRAVEQEAAPGGSAPEASADVRAMPAGFELEDGEFKLQD